MSAEPSIEIDPDYVQYCILNEYFIEHEDHFVRDSARSSGDVEILPEIENHTAILIKGGFLTVATERETYADGKERDCILYHTTKSGAEYHDNILNPRLSKKHWTVFEHADAIDRFIWFAWGPPKNVCAVVSDELPGSLAKQIAKIESAKALKIHDVEWSEEQTLEIRQILNIAPASAKPVPDVAKLILYLLRFLQGFKGYRKRWGTIELFKAARAALVAAHPSLLKPYIYYPDAMHCTSYFDEVGFIHDARKYCDEIKWITGTLEERHLYYSVSTTGWNYIYSNPLPKLAKELSDSEMLVSQSGPSVSLEAVCSVPIPHDDLLSLEEIHAKLLVEKFPNRPKSRQALQEALKYRGIRPVEAGKAGRGNKAKYSYQVVKNGLSK